MGGQALTNPVEKVNETKLINEVYGKSLSRIPSPKVCPGCNSADVTDTARPAGPEAFDRVCREEPTLVSAGDSGVTMGDGCVASCPLPDRERREAVAVKEKRIPGA